MLSGVICIGSPVKSSGFPNVGRPAMRPKRCVDPREEQYKATVTAVSKHPSSLQVSDINTVLIPCAHSIGLPLATCSGQDSDETVSYGPAWKCSTNAAVPSMFRHPAATGDPNDRQNF